MSSIEQYEYDVNHGANLYGNLTPERIDSAVEQDRRKQESLISQALASNQYLLAGWFENNAERAYGPVYGQETPAQKARREKLIRKQKLFTKEAIHAVEDSAIKLPEMGFITASAHPVISPPPPPPEVPSLPVSPSIPSDLSTLP